MHDAQGPLTIAGDDGSAAVVAGGFAGGR